MSLLMDQILEKNYLFLSFFLLTAKSLRFYNFLGLNVLVQRHDKMYTVTRQKTEIKLQKRKNDINWRLIHLLLANIKVSYMI
jgi:hypothetical protein